MCNNTSNAPLTPLKGTECSVDLDFAIQSVQWEVLDNLSEAEFEF